MAYTTVNVLVHSMLKSTIKVWQSLEKQLSNRRTVCEIYFNKNMLYRFICQINDIVIRSCLGSRLVQIG